MSFDLNKVQVWSAELEDKPGAASEKLRILAEAGADLHYVLARRQPGQPGKGILSVSPIRGKKQEEIASKAGFAVDLDTVAVRIEGTNKPGLGNSLAQAVADAGISLHGLTAAVTGKKFVAFMTFDNTADAEHGLKAIRRLR